MKKILVTGGSGFLGIPCIDLLRAQGCEVYAISSRFSGEDEQGIKWLRAELISGQGLNEALEIACATHLLHLAWVTDPREYMTSPANIDWLAASARLLHGFQAYGGKRVFVAGSCAEYLWNGETCVVGRTPIAPASLYGVSKNALHCFLEAFARVNRLEYCWGRLFHLYGAGEREPRLLASVIRSLLQDKTISCSSGEQIRDYLFCEDAAECIVTALLGDVNGAFNIASGQPITVRELLSRLVSALGGKDLIGFGKIPMVPGEVATLTADISATLSKIPWRPKTSLDEGLRKTITWHRKVLARHEH